MPSKRALFSKAISMNEMQLQSNADFAKCSDARLKVICFLLPRASAASG